MNDFGGYGGLPTPYRFWAKVRASDGCWEYVGGRFNSGYGEFSLDNKPVLAHRYCWELTQGPIPVRWCVGQICKNQICVRPDHLGLKPAPTAAFACHGQARPFLAELMPLCREQLDQGGLRHSDLAVRFWSKVRKGSGCWEWTAGKRTDGYGSFRLRPGRGGQISASRAPWEIHFGEIPEGLLVCHRCDNPPCVRPDHLFLGTDGDNTRDMMEKGRGSRGRRNPDVISNQHGTNQCYNHNKCRCQPCRDAHAAFARAERARKRSVA